MTCLSEYVYFYIPYGNDFKMYFFSKHLSFKDQFQDQSGSKGNYKVCLEIKSSFLLLFKQLELLDSQKKPFLGSFLRSRHLSKMAYLERFSMPFL